MRRFAIGALFLLLTISVFAQMPGMTPFSGDMNMKMNDGKSVTGKVYFSGTKARMEMNMAGRSNVLIVDIPAKTSYMVVPQQRMYMELKPGQLAGMKIPDLKSYDPSHPCAADTDVTCEKVGSENVNGRDTEKWIFTNKKTGSITTAWIDKKIHYAIRSQSKDVQTDLTNISEAPPSASLFEIPSDFRKFDMGAFAGGRPQPN